MGLGGAVGDVINIATQLLTELFPDPIVACFGMAFGIVVAVAARRSLLG